MITRLRNRDISVSPPRRILSIVPPSRRPVGLSKSTPSGAASAQPPLYIRMDSPSLAHYTSDGAHTGDDRAAICCVLFYCAEGGCDVY
jgi:hypothetical protein